MENLKEILGGVRRHILFFILLIGTIIYIVLSGTVTPESLVVGDELYSFSSASTPIINSNFDNSFFLTTSTETKYFDADGKEKMVHSALISDPVTSFAGDYLAVWNKKTSGTVFVLNNKDGLVYQIENSNTILDVDVNKNGYVAILVKDVTNSGYVLSVYNNQGQNIVSRVCDTENKYPISVSILDDNRIVALCEIDTNYLKPKSYISFSYLNEKDNKEGDVVFTGITLDDEIIANIDFRKNYLVAYAKNKVHFLTIANDTVKETGVVEVNNEITFAQIIDDKYIALSLGAPLNSNAVAANTLVMYTFDGKLVSETKLESAITNMTSADNSVIIVCGRKVARIGTNGKEDFSYSHSRDIVNAYYIGNKYPAVVLESNAIFPILKRN